MAESVLEIKIDGGAAEAQAVRLDRALDRLEDSGNKASRSADRTGRSLRAMGAQGRLASNSFDRLITRTNSVSRAFDGLRAGAGALFAGLGFKRIIDESRQFETGLLGVAKTTGIAGKELMLLGESIEGISRRIPVTRQELLELAQAAGQMGVTGRRDIEAFAETLAMLGRTTDVAGEEAARSIVRVLNVTGEAVGSVGEFGSVLVALGNSSAATEKEILRITTELARATSQFGLSSAEAASFGAAMSSIGIQAELGGSAVGRSFQVITNAISAGGAELTEFTETLGINSEELVRAFETDKVEAFKLFLEGVASTGLDAGAALKEVGLGGSEIAKTIIPLAGNIGILEKSLMTANEALDANSKLVEEFEAVLGSFDSQWQITQNIISEVGKDLGNNFLPTLTETLQTFNEWANNGNIERITTALESLFNVVLGVVAFKALRGFNMLAGVAITKLKDIAGASALAGRVMRESTSMYTGAAVGLTKTRRAASGATKAMIGLGKAVNLLGAAFIGFEIGTILRDNFVVARVAGAEFVRVMLLGIEHLRRAVGIFMAAWEFGFQALMAPMREFVKFMLDLFAEAFDNIPFGAKFAAEIRAASDSLTPAKGAVEGFKEEFARLNKEFETNTKEINKNIDGLVDYEITAGKGVKLARTHKDVMRDQKKAADALAKAIDEDLNESFDELFSGAKKVMEATEDLTDAQESLLDSLLPNKKALQDHAASFQMLNKLLEDGKISQQDFEIALMNLDAQFNSFMGFESFADSAEKATDQATPFTEAWMRAADRVDSAFEKAFSGAFDSFEDFADSLKSSFKQLIGTLVNQLVGSALANFFGIKGAQGQGVGGVLMQGVGSLFGLGGGGGTAGAGGAGFASAAGGGISSLLDSFGGTIVNAGSQALFGASLYNAAGISGILSTAGGTLANAAGISTAAAPIVTATPVFTAGAAGAAGAAGTAAGTAAAGAGAAGAGAAGAGAAGAGGGAAAGSSAFSGLAAAGPYIAVAIAIAALLASNKKPSNKEGNVTINPETGEIVVGGQTGRKFSQENRDRASALGTDTLGALRALERISGGETFQDTFRIATGDRDGTVFSVGAGRGQGVGPRGNIIRQGSVEDVLEAAVNTFSDALNIDGRIFKQFQEEGELLTTTVQRVVDQTFKMKDALMEIGMEFEISGEASIVAGQKFIELNGGAEMLAQRLAVFNELFGEQETQTDQLTRFTKELQMEFNKLGLVMPMTREGFAELVREQDINTEAGRKAAAGLLGLTGAMDAYINAIDRQQQALNAAVTQASSVTDNALAGLRSAVGAQIASLQSNYDTERGRIEQDFNTRIQQARQARGVSYAGQISSATSRASALQAAVQSLRQTAGTQVSPTIGSLGNQRRFAQQQLLSTLQGARAGGQIGDVTGFTNILSQGTSGLFGSASEERFDQAVTANRLNELGDLAGGQLSEQQQMIESLRRLEASSRNGNAALVASLERQRDQQVQALTEQFELESQAFRQQILDAEEQINAMRGVDVSVQTVEEALQALQVAIAEEEAAREAARHDAVISKLEEIRDAVVATGDQQTSVVQQVADNTLASADAAIEQQQRNRINDTVANA